jgi:hypothetical protein
LSDHAEDVIRTDVGGMILKEIDNTALLHTGEADVVRGGRIAV